jgi:hypothetical protein
MPLNYKAVARKRKSGAFADDEIMAFTNMTNTVKDVAYAIRDKKPIDVHPNLYSTVMDVVGHTKEALMATLYHLVDHKAQGTNFVGTDTQNPLARDLPSQELLQYVDLWWQWGHGGEDACMEVMAMT